MTITEFLLARITEDEAFVQRAIKSYQHVSGIPHYFDPTPGREFQSPMVGMSPYAARAECAAKRAIIQVHQFDHILGTHLCQDSMVDDDQCPVLRALAAAYADHPDYDEAWR